MKRSQLWSIEASPDVFAAVMATGIVSIAADAERYSLISTSLAGLAATAMTLLVAWMIVKAFVQQAFPVGDVTNLDVALRLFTFVAACAVLAAELRAHPIPIWTLGVIAVSAWLLLTPIVGRGAWSHRLTELRDRACGAWELASVATSGLAIVAALLAVTDGLGVLLGLALVFWILGILAYAVTTSLILWRAATTQKPGVWTPDSWILMGGLAIATLAGIHIHDAAGVLDAGTGLAKGVRAITVVTWLLASGWIPVLVFAGIRRIGSHPATSPFAWWAMVFPLGMYGVATHALSVETSWGPLSAVSLVFFWTALTAWLIVTARGTRVAARSIARRWRGGPSQLAEG